MQTTNTLMIITMMNSKNLFDNHNYNNNNNNKNNKIFFLLILLIIFDKNLIVNCCPSDVCICKWKGGKQTVECGSQMLNKLPEGMDPGTQVLNFSGNSLQILQNERFLQMDLINLQKIYLSRNQLIKIHDKSFRGLSNLVELDLSDNLLQQIPSETFQDYTSLMRLSLNGNPIRELKTSSFRYLSFLTTLELSNCHIERIENEAFIGMDNLEWLRLDGNRISYIQGNHILPKALHGISLQNNRWQCDCRLIDLHSWLINYNTPQIEEPKCTEPIRLKNQIIKTLKKDELACLPDVQPKSTYTEIFEGRNISIQCIVRAIPEPKVLWLFNGQVITNDTLVDNLHMYYYIDENGGEEKRSEVYIYNVGIEDNGTFSCIGQNIAGTAFSNYTLRVIIKEPPVVKEVQFHIRDYMNYIMISGGCVGCLFVLIICTIVIKCNRNQRNVKKSRNLKSLKSDSNSSSNNSNDTNLLKCPSIINEEEMTSPKNTKGNGILIGGSGGGGGGLAGNIGVNISGLGGSICLSTSNGSGSINPNNLMGSLNGQNGQLKQGFMMYVPSIQQNHLLDNSSMQLNSANATASSSSFDKNDVGGGNELGRLSSQQYCSPPSSVRNYQQDKNPDLINDTEPGQNKFKQDSSEYEGSECSTTGPCSLQSGSNSNYEYQITNQYGSQIIRPALAQQQQQQQRFTAMSTLPRGMHLKASSGNQHQVDVHLNPVCFLSQDGYAYDFSNNHVHNNAGAIIAAQQTNPQQQQQQQQQQQNFYRTLPHNRGGHNKLYSTASAANPGTRYSMETEFLQRSGTPTYDKYVQNMRFTAEGYPVHPAAAIAAIVQYPSPPDGYKTVGITSDNYTLNDSAGQSICPSGTSFQQWPPCLPGYHVQPIRYTTTTAASSPSTAAGKGIQYPAITSASQTISSSHTQTSGKTATLPPSSSSIASSSASSSSSNEGVKKRCVGAQTNDLETTTSTITECDEEQETATTTTTQNQSKLRHLTGPLADSPDEGYVGDSQEGSDI